MSNLVKSLSVVCKENNKIIIDTNEAVLNKIMEVKRNMSKETSFSEGVIFSDGLNATSIDLLPEDEEVEDNVSGNLLKNSKTMENQASDIIEEAKKKAIEIQEKAKNDASIILENAKQQSNDILEDSRQAGYEKGISEAKEQINNEMNKMKQENLEKEQELRENYRKKMESMETDLVDAILEVFVEVTQVLSIDKRDMILTLVNSVLSGNEVSNNYLIKVSREDAAFLRENKDRINGSVNKDINIEIVEDFSMKRNECLIDTDLGIYDCSLDIQLENLIRDIKILSCAVEK